MKSTKRPGRLMASFFAFASAAGIVCLSIGGCSGPTAPSLSPDEQARAKESIKKRFDDSSDKQRGKVPR